jgi:AraC-like DNA-binding protein
MPTSCWNIPDWELPVDTITLILDEHTYRTHNVVTPGSQTSAVLHVHSNGTTPGVETRQLMELCRNILARNSEDERGPYLAISLALTALKELISSPSNTLPGKSGSTWQAIDRYLQQHCGQIVDRDQVAHFFRLSPNYISTLCRDKTGHTFNYHLTSIRMERAISLLQSGEYTIAEIGSFCGYSDPSYFGRVFRKHFGTSPGRFCVARCKTTLTPEVTKNLS